MIVFKYIVIIQKYYDYITWFVYSSAPWIWLSTIQFEYEYNTIRGLYLIIIIQFLIGSEPPQCLGRMCSK